MALLKKLIHKRIGLTSLSICVSIISITVSLYWNTQLSGIINTINAGSSVLLRTILLGCATIVLSAGLAYLLGLCSGWTCETLAHDLRMGYATHFILLPIAEVENMNAGEQLSKLQNEINEVSVFLRANLFSVIDDLIKFIGTFSWLLWLNPKLALLANAPVALLMWYTVYSSRVIGRTTQESQQANMSMNGFADTLISVFPIMKLFEAVPLIQKQYDDVLRKWEKAGVKEEHTRARLMSLSAIFSCAPLMMLFLIGGTQIINGTTSIGTLLIFINLSGNVSGVMMNLPGRIASFRSFAVNMKRLEPSVLLEYRSDMK
jgi:ABC-type bacteriocin/lantibiotic exporter with double-glycine peptidase domain